MKNKLFNFRLLALFVVLITSINTAWGYYYIVGETALTGNNWDWYNPSCSMGVNNTITFMAKAAGTYEFKLYKYVNDNNKWDNLGGSITSASGTAYQAHGQRADGGNLWIQTNEVANITFSLNGVSGLDITVTKCAYYIKYPWWGRDNWYWSGALADCYDGEHYFTVGPYNGNNTQYCYGRKDSDGGADSNSSGGSDASTTTYHPTPQGSPSNGDNCYFIYNPSNHTLDIRAPHAITQPNYIYIDNSIAEFDNSDKIYFIIGHSKATPYQSAHLTNKVNHTKLQYVENTGSWSDAAYSAVIVNPGGWSGGSGVSYTSLKDATVYYSAVNWDYYPMAANHHYIVNMASGANGSPISLTDKDNATSNLNTTQTIKYSISRDGGTTYAEQTSGVTPAQITISAYKFVDGTYATVTNAGNEQSVSVNQSSKYSTTVDAAYTGETSLSYSSKRDGYTFIGWYTTADGNSTRSTTYNPKDETTTYARFKAHRYNIEFNANDAQYSTAPAATGSTATMSNVVYDQNATLTENGFSRAGYEFAGWAATPTGNVAYANGEGVTNLTSEDGTTITLYAKWTPIALTFSTAGNWSEASNWTSSVDGVAPSVPTIEHDVTIEAAATVSGSAVAKSVRIEDGGKVTIQPTGVLEVAGTVTNIDASKLIINTNSSNQGALIFDYTSAPTATVQMTLDGSHYQYIALPISGVSVSSAFAGSGVYTFVWNEGTGWERRRYYDDIMGYEPIAVTGISGSLSFSGILASHSGGTLKYTSGKEYAGLNMFANSLTAPIKVSAMEFEGSTEGAAHIPNGAGGWEGAVNADIIPAMQAYYIVASTSGSVSFDYDEAVRNPSSPNVPLKAPNRAASNDLSDHITVYVVGNEMRTRIRLFENEHFTDEIDKGYEAVYIEGECRAGELYAQASEKMNVLATNDLEGTILGFVPGEAASYTISFEGDGRGYYLNDMLTQQSTLIAEGNTYQFNPDSANNATRFVISRTPLSGSTATGVDQLNDGTTARKQMINGVLYIIREGKIYEATGKLVK